MPTLLSDLAQDVWCILASFVRGNEIFKLILVGNKSLGWKIQNSVEVVELKGLSHKFLDIDSMFRTAASLMHLKSLSLTSSFDGQLAWWISEWNILPSTLLSLKLDFRYSIDAFFLLDAPQHMWPSLQSLELRQTVHNSSTLSPRINLRNLPLRLRSLRIYSIEPAAYEYDYFDTMNLPANLEVFDVNVAAKSDLEKVAFPLVQLSSLIYLTICFSFNTIFEHQRFSVPIDSSATPSPSNLANLDASLPPPKCLPSPLKHLEIRTNKTQSQLMMDFKRSEPSASGTSAVNWRLDFPHLETLILDVVPLFSLESPEVPLHGHFDWLILEALPSTVTIFHGPLSEHVDAHRLKKTAPIASRFKEPPTLSGAMSDEGLIACFTGLQSLRTYELTAAPPSLTNLTCTTLHDWNSLPDFLTRLDIESFHHYPRKLPTCLKSLFIRERAITRFSPQTCPNLQHFTAKIASEETWSMLKKAAPNLVSITDENRNTHWTSWIFLNFPCLKQVSFTFNSTNADWWMHDCSKISSSIVHMELRGSVPIDSIRVLPRQLEHLAILSLSPAQKAESQVVVGLGEIYNSLRCLPPKLRYLYIGCISLKVSEFSWSDIVGDLPKTLTYLGIVDSWTASSPAGFSNVPPDLIKMFPPYLSTLYPAVPYWLKSYYGEIGRIRPILHPDCESTSSLIAQQAIESIKDGFFF